MQTMTAKIVQHKASVVPTYGFRLCQPSTVEQFQLEQSLGLSKPDPQQIATELWTCICIPSTVHRPGSDEVA